MDRYPQLMDDTAEGSLSRRPGRSRIGTRIGGSMASTVAGVFLVGALAFGANLQATSAPAAADPEATSATTTAAPAIERAPIAVGNGGGDPWARPDKGGDGTGGTESAKSPAPDPTEKPIATDEPDPTSKPTDKPEPKPSPEPKSTPKPTPKPIDKPDPTDKPVLSLTLTLKEGSVLVDFTACSANGAEYYKVVRSKDSTVTWPAGELDSVIGVVEIGGQTKAWDGDAPAGKKLWYRVFCVRHSDDGYVVLARSETKSITTPSAPATPKPTSLWLEASASDGIVTLHWEACTSDQFAFYKIVRKTEDGSSILATIEDHATTTLVDADVDVGATVKYQVYSYGWQGDQKVLLGVSDYAVVTVD